MVKNFLQSKIEELKRVKTAVVLLSGGLDSYVSLAVAKEYYDVKLALTFDYGQRAAEDEAAAAAKICEKYGVGHCVVKIPFLAEISKASGCALHDREKGLEFENLDMESMKAVWVPNRNGLFLNVAASYCDAYNYDCIIFGANKEEAGTFSDNSTKFCKMADSFFMYSTNKHPKVFAPLMNMEKHRIINLAVKLGVDLSLLKSCYNSAADNEGHKSHCGVCESCKRLKAAILKSENKDLIKLFF